MELDRVLVIGREGELNVGKPTIEGASVMATVKGEGKAKKIIVFKYKNKTRYDRKQGHRQAYTELNIDSISAGGEADKKTAKKPAPVLE